MLTFPAGILNPDQFNKYSAQWVSAVASAETDLLAAAFKIGGLRTLLARFPIDSLSSLLSTVGAHIIKIRFLLVPADEPVKFRFALTLFAVNVLNERVSGYYLADGVGTEGPPLPNEPGRVPTALAAQWLQHWQGAAQVSPALFTTEAGPLGGYNFALSDFMAPLRDFASFEGLELQVAFGLHRYVAPKASEAPTQTFGLLLRIYDPQLQVGSGLENMGTPCPPMH